MLDLELVTPPATDLVSLDEVKAHLGVETDEQDAVIEDLLATAIGHLDGYAGILGRGLVEQSWKLWLDRFPTHRCRDVRLPLPPLISVDEIAYTDGAGVARVLPAERYQVLDGERSSVAPAYGFAWPSARCQRRAVSITFTCGWAAPVEGAPWPTKLQPLRAALKLMVGDLFANREAQSLGPGLVVVANPTVDQLIRPLRVPRT